MDGMILGSGKGENREQEWEAQVIEGWGEDDWKKSYFSIYVFKGEIKISQKLAIKLLLTESIVIILFPIEKRKKEKRN